MTARNLTFGVDFSGVNASPLDAVNKKMDQVKDKAKQTGKGFTDMADKLDKMGKKAQSTGKTLMKGVTAPIVGIGTAAIATVSSFDDAMANVQKISGATGKEFDGMREKAKELGSTTAFSASEAADGMGILAASGMEANDIMSISKDMFDLMSAGSVDANTSASILTSTMSQFGLEAEDSAYIVDTFAASSAKAKISVDELEYVMSQAGGSLAGMNMEVHESTAAFGHLANAGLPVGQLGTTMNAMSREIKANASEFKSLGIDVYDPVTGKLKTMGDVMADVEGVVGGMNNAQRDAALSTVFSGQAMQGATAWINEGSEAYAKLTDEVLKEQKAAETMANIQEDTIGGAFRAVKSATEGLMIEIGDVIKGPVQEVAQVLQDLAGKFGELDGPTKKMIVKLAGVAAAIGPVIWAGGKLLSGVKLVGAAFGFIFSPIGLLVGALAGLAGATVYLWKTNEDFRDGVIQVWETVQEKVGSALEAISGFWDTHGEAIIQKVTEVFDWIGEKVMNGVSWLIEFWNEHGESIVSGVTETFNRIWGVVSDVLEIIQEVISSALTWITEFWNEHGETIQSATSIAWGAISGVIDGAMSIIEGVIGLVLSVIEGDWSAVWENIQLIFEGVMTAVGEAWDAAKQIVGKVIEGTVEAVTGAFMDAVEKAKEAWGKAKEVISAPIKGVMNIARNIKDRVTGGADGSHASGAYNIPFDGYLGELHKGEMVLTASASDQYRAMGGTENRVPKAQTTSTQSTKNTSATFNPSVYINIEGDASKDNVRELDQRIRNIFKREQKAFFDKLNLQT